MRDRSGKLAFDIRCMVLRGRAVAFQASASRATASEAAPPQPSNHPSVMLSPRALYTLFLEAAHSRRPRPRPRPRSNLSRHAEAYYLSVPCRGAWAMGAVEEKETGAKIPKEAWRMLHGLAAGWGDVADSKALEVLPLKGAMTNEVFEIKWRRSEGELARKVLVRIYGEGVEVFFNREDEIRTFECMSRHGQGPRLLGRFPSGRIEEFIHARTLSAVDLNDPEISALIASKLREFHELDMPGPKYVILWDRLRKWLKAAKSLCCSEEAAEFCLDSMEEEILSLEKLLSSEDHKIGFCHNDLQYGNIMMDEDTRIVTIIDYEYAGFNPIAFDIANHFCEMAADYHTETPHVLDYDKYPTYDERKRFVHKYLNSSGEEPDNEEVENLLQDIEKYALASHLVWGLWGIISEHVNEIDFDYIEYARQRFKQYWLMKPQILGS